MNHYNRSKSENTMTIIKQHEKRMRDQDQVEKIIASIAVAYYVQYFREATTGYSIRAEDDPMRFCHSGGVGSDRAVGVKDVDKCSERELRREVKALREGSCRFNCRSVKDAFYAGFDAARKTGSEPHNDCVCVYDTAKEAYRDWRKGDE